MIDQFFATRNKNVDAVPFAPAARFEGPLGSPITGAEEIRKFLRSVFPIIKGVRLQHRLSEGEYVAARFELETVYGTIPAFDWFHIVDGEIVEVRPYYDPRPITSGMERAAGAS